MRAAFKRQQLGIAGADADGVERAGHSASLASALTAAAAIALPPRRPSTTRLGHAPVRQQRRLRFRRADEADRHADHRGGRRRAGVEQFEQMEQRGRRVADRDHRAGQPRAPQVERGGRACVADAPRERRRVGVGQRADDVVAGGQARAGDAVRNHLRVAQDRRAGEQRRARGVGEAGRDAHVAHNIDHAAGVDDADRDARLGGGQAGQVCLGADGREGLGVDRRAIADDRRGSCQHLGGLGDGQAGHARLIARAAVPDEAVEAARANQRGRGRRMRAALGAAGDMDAAQAPSRQEGGVGAGRDGGAGTGWSAGAGGDAAARIVGIGDEAGGREGRLGRVRLQGRTSARAWCAGFRPQ